jgi:hypothetical protein
MAHVRFGLLRLAERHGVDPVLTAFAREVGPARLRQA